MSRIFSFRFSGVLRKLPNFLLWVTLFVLTGIGLTWACGGSFLQMLDRRNATLQATPYNKLTYEIEQITIPNAEILPLWDYDDTTIANQGLSLEQYQQTLMMRSASHGDEAYELGKGLPEDVRLYTAGAIDYHAALSGKVKRHVWQRAMVRFKAVLALPQDQMQLRSAWASYMLGRMHAQQIEMMIKLPIGMTLQAHRAVQQIESARYFLETRNRVRAGASDTEGLAAASMGEEARLYINTCRWQQMRFASDISCASRLSAEDFRRAIHLYMQQAIVQQGNDSHENAYRSLVLITDFALRNQRILPALLADEPSRRLLVAYTMWRTYDDESWMAYSYFDRNFLVFLADAVVGQAQSDLSEDADRLAALAYRSGRYDLAERFVSMSSSPLAAWVRAKLALQQGDMDAVSAAYAQAIKAFPDHYASNPSIAPGNEALLFGEVGVLVLSRSEYMEAMKYLFLATQKEEQSYYGENYPIQGYRDLESRYHIGHGSDAHFRYSYDASYIADRVLTLPELREFVDQYAPETPMPSPEIFTPNEYEPMPYSMQLRWLLARRLMREGYFDEAIPYFPVHNDPRIYQEDVRIVEQAQAYALALRKSQSFWITRITRAEYLFTAAMIARRYGIYILGYEQTPDFANERGFYSMGNGQTLEQLGQDWVSHGEVARYKASTAQPYKRFHYRYTAMDLASQAADNVPQRSQAFAAILCQSVQWGNRDARDQTYLRYIREGAYVPWIFGKNCMAPDFDKARRDWWKLQYQAAVRFLKKNPGWGIGAAATASILAAVLLCIYRFRRRKAKA